MNCKRSRAILRGVLGGPGTPECVLQTNGQPTEPPNECNLPIQLDPVTGILWVYDCDNNEWLATSDICSNRLAERNEITGQTQFVLSGCLNDEPVLMPEFDICSVPTVNTSWYQTTDPDFAYQVVCSPNTQSNDNGLIRVPFIRPFNVCEMDVIDQPSVDAGTSVQIPICIDGDQRLAPYVPPYSVCGLTSIDQTATDNATTVEVAACVDGTERLIPYVPPYEYSVCSQTANTQSDVNSGTLVEVALCIDGGDVKVPSNEIIPSDNIWTPEPFGSTTAGSMIHTGDSPKGDYIELGERIWFNIYIHGTWSVNFTGELRIPLPFTAKSVRTFVIKDVLHTNVSSDSDILAIINGGDNFMTLHKYSTDGATTPITDADQISTTNSLIINGFYIRN